MVAPPAPPQQSVQAPLARAGSEPGLLLHAHRPVRRLSAATPPALTRSPSWSVGFTFDAAESACTREPPADNCFPPSLSRLDAIVDFVFWCAAQRLARARVLTLGRRLDAGLTLRTALPTRGGAVDGSARHILDAYATSWLLPDLAATFPWDALVAGSAAAAGAAPSPLWLKLAKLPKLLRLRAVLLALRTSADVVLAHGLEGSSAGGAHPPGGRAGARLVQLLGGFLVLAHFGACAMWTASRWQVEHTPNWGIHGGLRPLALHNSRRSVPFTPEEQAVQAALCARRMPPGLAPPPGGEWTLYCGDLHSKYISMVYFALTTLVTTGFGDIAPGTNTEYSIAIGLQLTGCVAYALVFGNVALLLEGWDRSGARLRRRLAALHSLCDHAAVPPALVARIKAHAAAVWRAQRGCDIPAVMEALPPCAAAAVHAHLHYPTLCACPLLADTPPPLLRLLATQLHPRAFAAGDVILNVGEACAALHILAAGRVLALSAGGETRLAKLKTQGEHFGALSFTKTRMRRSRERYVADTPVGAQILELPRTALAAALRDFPDAAPRLLSAVQAANAVTHARRAERRAALAAGPGEASESSSDEEAGSPFMVQLIRARSTAAAQRRGLEARVASAAAEALQLEAFLDSALALGGARAGWPYTAATARCG